MTEIEARLVEMLRKLAHRVLDDGDNTPYDTAEAALALCGEAERCGLRTHGERYDDGR